MLTKREEFIKQIFLPKQIKPNVQYLDDISVNEIVKKISDIGNSLGYIGINISKDDKKNNQRKHKYDVWIAKEVKKNQHILQRIVDIRLIIDWACESKIDLFSYSFEEAFECQSDWHIQMMNKFKIEKLDIPNIDIERVVFRFSDKKHFIYLLNAEELKYEGKTMGHCVGGNNYKQKIKNNLSLLLSIRDNNNEPHVTIEIDIPSKMVVQQYGKGNCEPIQKYRNLIKEFLLFSTDYSSLDKKDVIKFLNTNFNTK